MLRVNLLGEYKIYYNLNDITGQFSSKGLALIAYLLANDIKEGVKREKLVNIMWPENNNKQAKYNMRHTLWSMKKTLLELSLDEIIISSVDKQYCYINPNLKICTDLFEFENLAKEIGTDNIEKVAKNNVLLDIYRGEFLSDFYLKNNIEFDDWLIFEREKHQRKHYSSVIDIVKYFESNKKYKKSIVYLEKLVRMNPLDESIHRMIMDFNYKMGNRVAGMKQFEKCSAILRTELNLSPMKETVKLAEIIKSTQETIVTKKSNYITIPYLGISNLIIKIFLDNPQLKESLKSYEIVDLKFISPEMFTEKMDEEKKRHEVSMTIEKIYDLRLFKLLKRLINLSSEIYEKEEQEIVDPKYDLFWQFYDIES